MRRNENNKRPTAGCLSVPLFNHKKRSRLPLTSNPSESEMFSGSEHRDMLSFTPTSQASTSTDQAPPSQRSQWNQQPNPHPQQTSTWSPASSGSTGRGYTLISHPRKPEYYWSQTGSQRTPGRQNATAPAPAPSPRQARFPGVSGTTQHQSGPFVGRQAMIHPSSSGQTNSPRGPFTPQQPLSVPANCQTPRAQSQKSEWKFKSVGQRGGGMWPEDSSGTSRSESNVQQQELQKFQTKQATAKSLRILTAVIEGMRYWSQYKDKVPMLFEIFATLDSAVTVGRYGAKNFLLRDSKHVVSCVYYENDQVLPRLIRGQVHRCVGNYDRKQDVLTCVSVRAASLSEQRNAQEAVKTSDAEMRRMVQMLNEM